MKKLSRRRFLGATAGAAVGIGSLPASAVSMAQAPAAGGQPATIQPDTTLILTNGRIHTMDARNTIARTVSIRNGRFVAVGDVNPARGANTRIIDLRGRTVVPGIIEGHVIRADPSSQAGTVTVEVGLDGALPNGARSDLSVDGTIQLEKLDNIINVGRPAFGQENSTVSIFKVLASGEAISTPVKLGRASVNTIEIVEGLQPGDQVILSDMSQYDSFNRVQLK